MSKILELYIIGHEQLQTIVSKCLVSEQYIRERSSREKQEKINDLIR